jgi:hypothetical protein
MQVEQVRGTALVAVAVSAALEEMEIQLLLEETVDQA